MNVGKSNEILSTHENFIKTNKRVILAKSSLDSRSSGTVKSRSGWEKSCFTIYSLEDMVELKKNQIILIDESQFLPLPVILELRNMADNGNYYIICYGLKNNFMGKLFEASKLLIERADKLVEMNGICHCGKKSTMILKISNSLPVKKGKEVDIGAEDKYVSVCHSCWDNGIF